MNAHVALGIAFALFVVGSTCDIRSSLGLRESNPLFRDRMGRFTPRRNALASVIYGLAVAVFGLWHPWGASLALTLAGIVRCGVGFRNRRVRRRLQAWTRRERAAMIEAADRRAAERERRDRA